MQTVMSSAVETSVIRFFRFGFSAQSYRHPKKSLKTGVTVRQIVHLSPFLPPSPQKMLEKRGDGPESQCQKPCPIVSGTWTFLICPDSGSRYSMSIWISEVPDISGSVIHSGDGHGTDARQLPAFLSESFDIPNASRTCCGL